MRFMDYKNWITPKNNNEDWLIKATGWIIMFIFAGAIWALINKLPFLR